MDNLRGSGSFSSDFARRLSRQQGEDAKEMRKIEKTKEQRHMENNGRRVREENERRMRWKEFKDNNKEEEREQRRVMDQKL